MNVSEMSIDDLLIGSDVLGVNEEMLGEVSRRFTALTEENDRLADRCSMLRTMLTLLALRTHQYIDGKDCNIESVLAAAYETLEEQR